MKKIVILGGGLSGLAAAQKLCKQFDVIILEKKDYLGGLAASFEHNREKIPIYYHHVIQSNKTTQRYLKRYGLLSSCRWQKINTRTQEKKLLTKFFIIFMHGTNLIYLLKKSQLNNLPGD